MKRRIDVEPTCEAIDRALVDDLAGRKEDLRDFVRLLDSVEGNFSIFLNGEWGSGKTFFVKEAERLLTLLNINYQMRPHEDGSVESFCLGIESDGLCNPHVPIYFNAWEYDYCDCPIVSLMEVVISSFHELVGLDENGGSLGEKAVSLLKALKVNVSSGFIGTEIDCGQVAAAFQNNSPLKELQGKKEIRNKLKDLLDEAKAGRGNRIVLFVDELDRCRPEYAIKTLEALKSLFDQDYLTLVFSVNAKALGMSVSSWYGGGFDGSRYLMRFYDAEVRLGAYNSFSYLSSLGLRLRSMDDFVLRFANRKDVTMRDVNRWIERIKQVSNLPDYSSCENSRAASFCMKIIVPGAIVYSTLHPDKALSVFGGFGGESFKDWLFEDPLYVDVILDMPGEWFSEKDASRSGASARDELFCDDALLKAGHRFDEFYRIIFDESEDPRLRSIGDIQAFQIRKAARRALQLTVM